MIGLIVAMPLEADKILTHFCEKSVTIHSSLTFYEGKIDTVAVVMALSGIGKVNAAYATAVMIQNYAPQAIISTGIVGGLGKLPTLTQFVPDKFCQHDVDTSALGDPVGFVSTVNRIYFDADCKLNSLIRAVVPQAYGGILASGDQFVSSDSKALSITSQFGAVACDMEAGAIAQVCYINNIPFAAIKVVSDNANGGAEITYCELSEKASEINSEILVLVLSKMDINYKYEGEPK